MRVLKLLFAIQLWMGWLWVAPLATMQDPGLGILAVFFYTAPVHLAFMVTAAVYFFRRRETRRWAAIVFATPIAILFLPLLVRGAFGGPVLQNVDLGMWLPIILLGSPIACCLFLPHEVARYVPTWLLASRVFHITAIALLALMLVSWLVVVACLYPFDEATFEANAGLIVFAFFYAIACAVVGPLVFLGSYVCMFQRRDRRQQALRVVQGVLSLLLLVPAVPVIGLGLFALSLGGIG